MERYPFLTALPRAPTTSRVTSVRGIAKYRTLVRNAGRTRWSAAWMTRQAVYAT